MFLSRFHCTDMDMHEVISSCLLFQEDNAVYQINIHVLLPPLYFKYDLCIYVVIYLLVSILYHI